MRLAGSVPDTSDDNETDAAEDKTPDEDVFTKPAVVRTLKVTVLVTDKVEENKPALAYTFDHLLSVEPKFCPVVFGKTLA